MLDKTSKRIIDCLSKQPDQTIFYYNDWPDEISDIDESVIFACVRYLIEHNLCERCTSAQTGQSIGVRLSHEGLHRKEFFLMHTQEFLYKSIIVPVIVALFTSLIASSCSAYFSRMDTTDANTDASTTATQQEPSFSVTR